MEWDNEQAYVQILENQEFVAWAFKENAKYRDVADPFKRMSNAAYLTPIEEGFDLASKSVRGLIPVELDREVGCGWRILDGDGRGRTGWRISPNRSTAMSEANSELWDQDRSVNYGFGRPQGFSAPLRVLERQAVEESAPAPAMR